MTSRAELLAEIRAMKAQVLDGFAKLEARVEALADEPDRWLRIGEVEEITGLPRSTIYRLAGKGTAPTTRNPSRAYQAARCAWQDREYVPRRSTYREKPARPS